MNLLVDGIAFASQNLGGVSRVWEEYLKRLPDYGFRIKLLIPFRHTNSSLARVLEHKERYDIVPDYFFWPKRFFGRVSVRSTLLSAYLDSSVDVFQSTYLSTICSAVPKVILIHDMIPELFPAFFPEKWIRSGIEMKRAAVESANHIVAVSQNTKNDLLKIYPAIRPEKVTVIPNGSSVALNRTGVAFDLLAKRHGLAGIPPRSYLLYVGSRNGHKNFGIILELLRNTSTFRDLRVLCAGGESLGSLPTLLADIGLSRNLIFLSAVSDEELSILYQNALALIYPSIYEGFGLPVLEAMTNRCPVICSNTSSLPEVGGDAAFYFTPSSFESLDATITQMMTTDRSDVIEKGLRNAARFSWDLSTRSLATVYESLI